MLLIIQGCVINVHPLNKKSKICIRNIVIDLLGCKISLLEKAKIITNDKEKHFFIL